MYDLFLQPLLITDWLQSLQIMGQFWSKLDASSTSSMDKFSNRQVPPIYWINLFDGKNYKKQLQ